jgi:hypothetical protein
MNNFTYGPTGWDRDADIFEKFCSESLLHLDEQDESYKEIDEAYESYKEKRMHEKEEEN